MRVACQGGCVVEFFMAFQTRGVVEALRLQLVIGPFLEWPGVPVRCVGGMTIQTGHDAGFLVTVGVARTADQAVQFPSCDSQYSVWPELAAQIDVPAIRPDAFDGFGIICFQQVVRREQVIARTIGILRPVLAVKEGSVALPADLRLTFGAESRGVDDGGIRFA